jgi:hypothetical protein
MRSMLDQPPPVSGVPPLLRDVRMNSRDCQSEKSFGPCADAHPEKDRIATNARISSRRKMGATSTPPILRIKKCGVMIFCWEASSIGIPPNRIAVCCPNTGA